MRCTQVMGLSEEAEAFLQGNALIHEPKRCECCSQILPGEPVGYVSEVWDRESGRDEGMFQDGPELYKYALKDGSEAREVVQVVPWSSGPCIFLCLQLGDNTKVGEWTQEEIKRQMGE